VRAFTSSIQNSIEGLKREMRIKEIKGIQVRKEAVKPFLFEDMILYVENPKNPQNIVTTTEQSSRVEVSL
jgi:hypothetical protein